MKPILAVLSVLAVSVPAIVAAQGRQQPQNPGIILAQNAGQSGVRARANANDRNRATEEVETTTTVERREVQNSDAERRNEEGRVVAQRFDNDGRDERRDNDRRFDNDRRDNDRSDNDRRDNDRRFDNDRRDRRFDNDRGRRNFGYTRDPRLGRDFRFRGRSFVSVRAPRFDYPRGYGYRRWAIGATLPFLFLSEPYYVDYDYIGLPPPRGGEEWVRYGPDALLVDTRNGRVIDTAYGVFY
jgi:Ni/Co efflux regulator RcnB